MDLPVGQLCLVNEPVCLELARNGKAGHGKRSNPVLLAQGSSSCDNPARSPCASRLEGRQQGLGVANAGLPEGSPRLGESYHS